MISIRSLLMASVGSVAIAGAGHAQAVIGQADANSVATGEDIIVTAQKRNQALIDVPQSVSVITGATLERQQAVTFGDYLKNVPGLQINQSNPGEARLILRGINTGGVASTVAVYVDEVPFGSSTGLANGATLAGDFDTFDIAQIEILRGPQGTLYGANSLGGLLKFVTNAPQTDKLVVRGRAGVETVSGGQIGYYGNAVVNVPLGDTLAVRASGFYRKDGGFIDSIGTGGSNVQKNINGDRTYGGRASLLFKPSDRASFRLTAIAQNIDVNAPTVVDADPLTLRQLYGGDTVSQFVPQFRDIRYRVYTGTANVDLGFADLTSASGYSTQKQSRREDFSANLSPLIAAVFGTPNNLFLSQRTNNEKYDQELRLSSGNRISFLDIVAGAYYTHEKALISQQYNAVNPGTLTPVAGLPLLADVNLRSRYEEIAGFGNVTVHLGDRFDVDLGGRYSHNKQRAAQTTAGALAGGTNVLPISRSSDNVFTYSVAPKFKLTPDASLYARVAKGYRPGGPNALAPGAPAGTPRDFGPDTVISYEAGFKGQTADNSFSLEVSGFYIDWSRIQLLAVINGFGVNTNAGKARSEGAEFTATARPAPGLVFSVNGAYTDAKLTQDAPAIVGGLRGDPLPFSPKISVSANGDYTWNLSEAVKAFAGASVRLLSRQYANFDTTYTPISGRSQPRVPSYEVVDLRAGVDFGRFTLEAYAKNLTDSGGIVSVSPRTANGFNLRPAGAVGTGIIRPRTVGVALTAAY
ncbi:TonB-dependent receptor [Sphingosinicellaceae bacterium]|nr:TonB-dependent receptor [Sphingosinicellaceae bacterium]